MKWSSESECFPFGATSLTYSQTIRKSLPAFTLGRLTPTIGISAVFLLMAHKSPDDLAVFAYVLAAVSVISGFCSLVLAAVGNRVASLADSPSAQQDVFTSGFTLALCLAVLTFLGCLLATFLISKTGGIRHMDTQAYWTLSLMYVASTPLLVISGFLQLYLEATGKAAGYASARTSITVCCIGILAVLFAIVRIEDFKYWAMSYFFVSELITLIVLSRLSGNQRYLSWTQAKANGPYFIRTGLPIAAGMSGQKLYFYLLTERLARIDAHLVAELSVFMTVVGLLIIPSVAFAQIHSLQVSRQIGCSKQYFRTGLGCLFGGLLLITTMVFFLGEYVFHFIGGAVVDYSAKLALTLITFLTSSSLLALALGHLRALSETFVPQLVINIIMLALLIPTIYMIQFDMPDLEDFLMLQSAAAFVGFLVLGLRIVAAHQKMRDAGSL